MYIKSSICGIQHTYVYQFLIFLIITKNRVLAPRNRVLFLGVKSALRVIVFFFGSISKLIISKLINFEICLGYYFLQFIICTFGCGFAEWLSTIATCWPLSIWTVAEILSTFGQTTKKRTCRQNSGKNTVLAPLPCPAFRNRLLLK